MIKTKRKDRDMVRGRFSFKAALALLALAALLSGCASERPPIADSFIYSSADDFSLLEESLKKSAEKGPQAGSLYQTGDQVQSFSFTAGVDDSVSMSLTRLLVPGGNLAATSPPTGETETVSLSSQTTAPTDSTVSVFRGLSDTWTRVEREMTLGTPATDDEPRKKTDLRYGLAWRPLAEGESRDANADWLAGGYWMHRHYELDDDDNEFLADLSVGFFVDGPVLDPTRMLSGLSGEATYEGEANGLYMGSYDVPLADGSVGEVGTWKSGLAMRIDFDDARGPVVGGSLNGVRGGGHTLDNDYEVVGTVGVHDLAHRVTLADIPMPGAQGQVTTGSLGPVLVTSGSKDGVATSFGSWGVQVSGQNFDVNGKPGGVAGTVGAAFKPGDESDFLAVSLGGTFAGWQNSD